MRAHVVIATKGRPKEVAVLLGQLIGQTQTPASIIVVGAGESDIEGLAAYRDRAPCPLEIVIQDPPGLPRQRNRGVDTLAAIGAWSARKADDFVVFYDDDFRPDPAWIENAAAVFAADPSVVGLTGVVLADGVTRSGLGEEDAIAFIRGERAPEKHWASGETERDMLSAYGCNMAFRGDVFDACRFDENLPMYAWQEDRDFTGQALRLGRVILTPRCRGVHLGVKGGRQSGVRFGYSQIANPIYLAGKGTISAHRKRMFLARALAANCVYSLSRSRHADYPGRLKGNFLAIRDLFAGTCRPQKILEL